MDEPDTIEVVVLERRHPPTGRQALPKPEDLVERVMNVPIATLRESIRKATVQVTELVRGLPTMEGPMQLDEISVGLTISASGEVQLIAGIGVEVGNTITLTFKVTDSSDNGTS